MRQTAILLHSAALRWGNMALIIALIGTLGLVCIVAIKAPQLTILLPVAFGGLCFAALLFSRPRLNFIFWLGGLALLFSSEKGIQVHEAVYGLYFYAYLAHWYGRRLLLYKRPIIQGVVDISVALWLVLGLGLGIALGLLFGADLIRMRGEAIALTMLAIYFPIKEFCIRDKHGSVIILAIIAWIGVWVTVDNALVARQTFAEATMLWEIVDVRTAGRELLLTFAGILLLAVLPSIRKLPYQALVAFLLVILIGGLLITKSRTFWVQYIVALIILLVLSPTRERRRLLAWSVAGFAILLFAGIVFLPSYFNLLITGITSRFSSLSTASVDLSLLNRYVETSVVLQQVSKNPILGYGFGTHFSFFNIITYKTITNSYSHNGLIAVWYKFGLWGSVIVASTWLLSMNTFFRDTRRKIASAFDRAILRGLFACSLSMVLPALTSSVFFEDEKIAAFMIITALGIGIHYKLAQAHH